MGVTSEQLQASDGPIGGVDFVHTGPGTLAGGYLRRFWQPVARAEDLPAGRAVPIRIMSEDLTLYRGESRTPHVLAFRCAHRGTQLSTGWVEGENLRCFYHGWKYDPSGQCIEQPAEPEPFCQKIRIRSYPTREYLGLVFAYLAEGEPPAFPRYQAFEQDGVIEVGPATPARVNYFNRIDNAPDHAHLVFVHSPFMSSFGMPRVESDETEYGVRTRARFPNGWLNETHFVMPNVSLFPGRPRAAGETVWTDQIAWVVPVDDEHYRFVQVTITHGVTELTGRFGELRDQPTAPELGEAVIAGTLQLQEVMKRADIFEVQDCVSQGGQGIIAPRGHEHLGRSDVGVVLLRKVWERELRRLAAGRALKEWNVPQGLVATLGPVEA